MIRISVHKLIGIVMVFVICKLAISTSAFDSIYPSASIHMEMTSRYQDRGKSKCAREGNCHYLICGCCQAAAVRGGRSHCFMPYLFLDFAWKVVPSRGHPMHQTIRPSELRICTSHCRNSYTEQSHHIRYKMNICDRMAIVYC